MLEQMLNTQQTVVNMMGVPRGLAGVQEATIGMVKEAAEILEEVYPGTKAWSKVNYEAADKEAIDVLLYLLEYFVLRGMTAEDIFKAYYDKVDIVTKRHVAGWAEDKQEARRE